MLSFYVELMAICGIRIHVLYSLDSDGTKHLHSAERIADGSKIDIKLIAPVLATFESAFPDECNTRYQEWRKEMELDLESLGYGEVV